MFDPDIRIPDIARGAAIPPAMQLEFKRQEQESAVTALRWCSRGWL